MNAYFDDSAELSIKSRVSLFNLDSNSNFASRKASFANQFSKFDSLIFSNTKLSKEQLPSFAQQYFKSSLYQLPDCNDSKNPDLESSFSALTVKEASKTEIPELKLVSDKENRPLTIKTEEMKKGSDSKPAAKSVIIEASATPAAPQPAKSSCNCKKTKCLKLYCECFANGGVCGPSCNCSDCHNSEELKDLRELIIQETLEKNPLAFKSKYKQIESSQKSVLHSRGCNCKKTGCSKNYCECYTAGIGCSKLCKCKDCKNENIKLQEEELKPYHEKVLRKRKKPNYLYDFYFTKYSKLKQN